jgi:glycoprotein-N-acetylgalactosamine 3-beta-galactosyltransferase
MVVSSSLGTFSSDFLCSPGCDGFMVGSNKTDVSIGAVDIPHEGPEEYNNIWQKVRSMWSYIYDNYYDKYDWFHIGGDDLYLIVENLRLYLESDEIRTAQNGGIYLPSGDEKLQTPLFLGRRFKYMGDPNDIFNSGGSGYTMNKAALKLLVVNGFPNYFPHAHTFSEDTMVARIFKKMDVYPYDTKDEEGGERYNPFDVSRHDSSPCWRLFGEFLIPHVSCILKAWTPLGISTTSRYQQRLVCQVFN